MYDVSKRVGRRNHQDERWEFCVIIGGRFGEASRTLTPMTYFLSQPFTPLGPHEFKHSFTLTSSTALLQFPHKPPPHESKRSYRSLILASPRPTSTLTAPHSHETSARECPYIPATYECPNIHTYRSSTNKSNLTCFKTGDMLLTQSTLTAVQFYSHVMWASRG